LRALARVAGRWHDVPVSAERDDPGAVAEAATPGALAQAAMPAPEWITFRRADAGAVIEVVRAVADAGDPGEHGHGVEVVVEPPRPGWLAGLFGGRDSGDQARIVVTKAGGEVSYPFHVQLVSEYGANAARRVPRLPGWASSRCAGLAFVMLKGIPEQSAGVVRYAPVRRYDWAALVGGAIVAVAALRDGLPEDGEWRARLDRAIRRT
jgi:hypothetical protein